MHIQHCQKWFQDMKSDKWKYILSHKDISLEYTMLLYKTLRYDAPFKGQKHVPRYKT